MGNLYEFRIPNSEDEDPQASAWDELEESVSLDEEELADSNEVSTDTIDNGLSSSQSYDELRGDLVARTEKSNAELLNELKAKKRKQVMGRKVINIMSMSFDKAA